MIEMLGVLAIIGVLSAGGIMGYSTAMENYKVNKFVDDVKKMHASATSLLTQNSNIISNASITTNTLCRLGIVFGDYCQKITPLEGATANIYLVQRISSSYAYIDINGKHKNGKSNISTLAINNLGKSTDKFTIPKSMCIKLLSNQGWKNSSILTTFYIEGVSDTARELPLSPASAERSCNLAINNSQTFLYITNWITEIKQDI